MSSFYGCHFSFDGIPCDYHDLTVYDFGRAQDVGGSFTSSGSVVEESIARRHKKLYYGTMHDRPLEFRLVFGANDRRIQSGRHFDRWDLEVIASWMTGLDGYRWLEITQPDMETVRYRVIITELSFATVGWMPWAFECRIVCDSAFGYTYPETFRYNVEGSKSIPFFSRSTLNGFYYPQMELHLSGGSFVNIVNESDNGRVFSLTNLPSGQTMNIKIDNENGIITNNRDHNLYMNFNMNFFRLVRGDNKLQVTGNCKLFLMCEFPVNIGA